jgi:hypothetical protein
MAAAVPHCMARCHAWHGQPAGPVSADRRTPTVTVIMASAGEGMAVGSDWSDSCQRVRCFRLPLFTGSEHQCSSEALSLGNCGEVLGVPGRLASSSSPTVAFK